MKFTTALVLSGAAMASAAAVVPKGVDHCPAVKKTVKITWIENKEYKKPHTWTKEEAKKCIQDSKYDPKQVYPSLNGTKTGYQTSKPTTTRVPYPTGTWYGNGTNTYTAHPTGGAVSSSAASSTISSSAPSSTPSQPPADDGVCRNPTVRTEWSNLSEGERRDYIGAVKCLMEKPSAGGQFPGSNNRYEDVASVHQQLANEVHSVGAFLPFHRYMVHVFFELLRDECGYTGRLPWWNEAKDAGNFRNAHVFQSGYFGTITEAVGDNGVCVDDAGWGSYTANLGPIWTINNPHCVGRALDEGWSGNTRGSEVEECRGAQNYNDYRLCNERRIHAAGHYAVGAVMIDAVTSPEDPIFYMHHGFVDQAYYAWQSDAGHRIFEIGGNAPNGGDTTPSDRLHSFGIRPDVSIADVLDTKGGYLCYVYDQN